MKKKVVKGIQKFLKRVSLNSVGRSVPPGIYEEKISDELRAAVMEVRNKN